MQRRIHYHSDCAYFAGCENMLANFFNSDQLMGEFSVSFSYRQSDAYDAGFHKRVSRKMIAHPLALRDVSEITAYAKRLPWLLGPMVQIFASLLLIRYWFVLWNTWILFLAFEKVDLLHINNGNYPGAYSCMSAVFAARLRGIRHVVYVVNNIAIPYSSPRRWLDYPLDRVVAENVSLFVTASRHASAALAQVLRLATTKAVSMRNGISPRLADESRDQTLARLGIPAGRMLIGVVAVLDPRKGHLVLLEALLHIKRMNRDQSIPFIIIEGRGEMKLAITVFIAAHDLGKDVLLIGSERNIFNLMNSVDAICLPSVSHEDFPNVVLEAMSLGKPVIASRLAGIPEQIEHMKSGVLVECGDSSGLAEAMVLLASDPALRQRIGDDARRRFAESFDARTAVSGYVSLYRELIGMNERKPD